MDHSQIWLRVGFSLVASLLLLLVAALFRVAIDFLFPSDKEK